VPCWVVIRSVPGTKRDGACGSVLGSASHWSDRGLLRVRMLGVERVRIAGAA
jgi:hypothetical protein